MDAGNTVLIAIGLILSIVNSSSQNFEGFVVNGDFAKISDFPHSAFLSIECVYGDRRISSFTCGSSILNQVIVLTAAHCLENCEKPSTTVTVHVGKRTRKKGLPYVASSFKIHEKYDTRQICNDIALVRLKRKLIFGSNVRRVALVRDTQYAEPAEIAGWGWIQENPGIQSQYLMRASQKVWSRPGCMQTMGNIPQGTICGGALDAQSYVAAGDSGSGLMVRRYIQIGIVSYKVPQKTTRLAIYTEVAYFYDWIRNNAKRLNCRGN